MHAPQDSVTIKNSVTTSAAAQRVNIRMAGVDKSVGEFSWKLQNEFVFQGNCSAAEVFIL